MLWDPRHDKTPSMAGFALFVASKNPNESYNWCNCRVCAVGQYLTEIGMEPTGFAWEGEIQEMNQIARGNVPVEMRYDESDWTFGKLADRILKHQMKLETV